MKTCEFPECGKSSVAKGWCDTHYRQFRKTGRVTSYTPCVSNQGKCSVEECQGISRKSGMCIKHYQRYRRTGRTSEIPTVCPACSQVFPGATSGSSRFCSKECRNRWGSRTRRQYRGSDPGCWFARDQWTWLIRDDRCYYCGGPGEHLDHVDPISRGGSDSWENLARMCAAHNGSKNAKGLLFWMLERSDNVIAH